jgi:hypothetical protein
MSDVPPPSPPPPVPPRPPEQRNGCLMAIMLLFGVILLLPGLCALIFGIGAMTDNSFDQTLLGLVVLGLAVGFGGIMLIRSAIRGPRP